jgi:hypothetical protein
MKSLSQTAALEQCALTGDAMAALLQAA